MTASRLSVLTAQQLACLRKVAELKDSAVIAHELGIAPKTVNSHIEAACRRLGVSTRREAARIVRQYDQEAAESFPGDFVPIAENDPVAPFPEAVGTGDSIVRDGGSHPVFDASHAVPATIMPAREDHRHAHFVSHLKIVALIVTIATAVVMLLTRYPALIVAAKELANSIQPPGTHDK